LSCSSMSLELGMPVVGLVRFKLIEEQLKKLIRRNGWTILYIGINDFEPFKEIHGFVAGDDILRFVAIITSESVDELGTVNDFIGHIGGDDFILITTAEKAEALRQRLIERFQAEVGIFYSFREKERGFMIIQDADGNEREVPLMSLAVGVVPEGPFADIREITEAASTARRNSARR